MKGTFCYANESHFEEKITAKTSRNSIISKGEPISKDFSVEIIETKKIIFLRAFIGKSVYLPDKTQLPVGFANDRYKKCRFTFLSHRLIYKRYHIYVRKIFVEFFCIFLLKFSNSIDKAMPSEYNISSELI